MPLAAHRVTGAGLAGAGRKIGLAVAGAGLLVLCGWALDIELLKSFLPGLTTMKANTALGFLLAGLSLGLLSTPEAGGGRAWSARALATGVTALAALTLAEYAFDWRLGLDEMLFREPAVGAAAAHPGRMAPMTAVNFALLGMALLAIDLETRAGWRPSNWLALAIAGNCFLAMLGYAYGVDALYRVTALTAMALHTAILFVVASIGLAVARPASRFMRQLTGDSAAALINRRLLPAAILLPPFLGWLRLLGQQAGYYSTSFGLAVFAMSNVVVFTLLVWWAGRSLQRLHEQRVAVTRTSDWQQAILNSADFTVISTDVDGTIRTMNAGAADKLGYSPEELVDKMTPAVIHDPEEVSARAAVLTQELGRKVEPGFGAFVAKAQSAGSDENDWTYVRKDGSRFPVRLSVTPLRDVEGELTGFLGIGKDISAQKLAEQRLAASQARLRTITDAVPALICYIDRERRFEFNNATYGLWLGRPLDQITGRRLDEVYEPVMMDLIRPAVEAAFAGRTTNFELRSPVSGRFLRGTYVPDHDASGRVVGVYGLINDISSLKEAEEKLRQLTQHDALTGLANRSRLEERLAQAIARSERNGAPMALVFLDMDEFKSINDTLGHHAGDAALQELARRLKQAARDTDTVARLAGDEFVLILEGLSAPGDETRIAEKILAAMALPFDLLGVERICSASLGIVRRRAGETDAEALLRRADAALYQAKAAGRGRYHVAE